MQKFTDFAWYWNNYNTLTYNRLGEYNKTDYKCIPFEFKIGLLKYICNDQHFKTIDFAHLVMDIALKNYLDARYESLQIIVKICPKEFLQSIFN